MVSMCSIQCSRVGLYNTSSLFSTGTSFEMFSFDQGSHYTCSSSLLLPRGPDGNSLHLGLLFGLLLLGVGDGGGLVGDGAVVIGGVIYISVLHVSSTQVGKERLFLYVDLLPYDRTIKLEDGILSVEISSVMVWLAITR